MGLISLVEIEGATDALGTTTMLRFCTGRGYTHPTAPGPYEPCIEQASNVTRSVFEDLRTFGASKKTTGEVSIKDPSGQFDPIMTYGYGRPARRLLGEETGPYENFVPVLTGSVEQPTADFRTKQFRWRDRQLELEQPMQTSRFAGTNSGATGIEGTADDIKGQVKPRLFGVKKNIPMFCLNTSTRIYGCNFDRAGNTAPVYSFDQVRDGGAVLSLDTGIGTGGDFANLAALQGATIGSGKYATCKAEGLIRLQASPAKQITADVTEGATAADRKVAGLIQRLLLDAGVDAGDISAADVAALAIDAPYVVGIYVPDEAVYRDGIDRIAASGGAYYGSDEEDIYRMAQIKAPAGDPVYTFKRIAGGEVLKILEGDIISLDRVAISDPGRGIPAWKTNLNYQRLGITQRPGELAGIADSLRSYLEAETRAATPSSDDSIKLQFPHSPELTFETEIDDPTDAATENARRFAIYSVLRDTWRMRVKAGSEVLQLVKLASVVELQIPRFGLDSGKKFLVLGQTTDARLNIMDLTIWG